MENVALKQKLSGEYQFGFHDADQSVFKSSKGLTEDIVRQISSMKGEPAWMLSRRLDGLRHFLAAPLPSWGADLSTIDFESMNYYVKPTEQQFESWDDVPADMKRTFERLGIPEAERKFLAGVGAQYDSEVVYHNLRKELSEQGVIFSDMDTGLREHGDIVKKYFGTVVPAGDNKFAALNTATWSGGSFAYVPSGVRVEIPLQAYFRINAKQMGQFERTLIIAEPGSFIHYVEGCFTKGTPVATRNGLKPIEEIKVGDRVLTHQRRYRSVTKAQVRKYSGTLYKFAYFGDSTQCIEATAEHPFLVCRKQRAEYANTKWDTEWAAASTLRKGDYLAIPIDRSVDEKEYRTFSVKAYDRKTRKFYHEKIVLHTDADFFRLIGYYLSEGTTIGDHYLSFAFNFEEREYIDDVKALLKRYFCKPPLEYPEHNHGISLVLCSTDAARLFAELFGNHASKKRIPSWLHAETLEKQAELVKGFWRGDGSYGYTHFSSGRKVNYRMTTISEGLARSLQAMLLRLDVFASMNRWKKHGNRQDAFALTVGGSYLRRFGTLVSHSITLPLSSGQFGLMQVVGRVSYARISGDYAFVPIRSITPREASGMDVHNLSIDGDESYVAGGVAVHNCSAPVYSTGSLHAAVVEIIALPGSRVRYTTIQNWSSDVYNLVTKRSKAYRDSTVEWIDGNVGSRITMKYPAILLMEEGARGEVISIAFAGKGQHQDAGAKIYHLASNTSSNIISKSISKDGGRTTYRGLVSVLAGLSNIKSNVECDALILDEQSASDTVPYMSIASDDVSISHEASVSKLDAEKLFYLQTRGFSEEAAKKLLVQGFVEPFVRQLPMEYAIELNRLIELEMEGSVG